MLGWPDWLQAEWPGLLTALGVTLTRLGLTLLCGLALGLGAALLMRVSTRLEGALTPWVLAVGALPWLLIMVTVNMVPNLGLRENGALLLSALALATPLFSLGRRRLEVARAGLLRRALWSGCAAVMAGELLSRTDGVGAMIRYYALFTRPERLALYLGAALLIVLGYAALARLLERLLRTTPLWTPGRVPGPRPRAAQP